MQNKINCWCCINVFIEGFVGDIEKEKKNALQAEQPTNVHLNPIKVCDGMRVNNRLVEFTSFYSAYRRLGLTDSVFVFPLHICFHTKL